MSFIRFDLTSYSRSIALGVEYENTTLSAPINEWSWVLDGDKIVSQISSFDPLFKNGLIEMSHIMETLILQTMVF